VENPVSVHDFHAAMLHLLGVDAAKLYRSPSIRVQAPVLSRAFFPSVFANSFGDPKRLATARGQPQTAKAVRRRQTMGTLVEPL
jgi:hypothetical protein